MAKEKRQYPRNLIKRFNDRPNSGPQRSCVKTRARTAFTVSIPSDGSGPTAEQTNWQKQLNSGKEKESWVTTIHSGLERLQKWHAVCVLSVRTLINRRVNGRNLRLFVPIWDFYGSFLLWTVASWVSHDAVDKLLSSPPSSPKWSWQLPQELWGKKPPRPHRRLCCCSVFLYDGDRTAIPPATTGGKRKKVLCCLLVPSCVRMEGVAKLESRRGCLWHFLPDRIPQNFDVPLVTDGSLRRHFGENTSKL